VYLLAQVNNQARRILILHRAGCAGCCYRAAYHCNALPASLAYILPAEQSELTGQSLRQMPEDQERPRLTKYDWMGALGICALGFLSTFPTVSPVVFVNEAKTALQTSSLVTTAILLVGGCAFGSRSGLRPWATGLSMVAIGAGFVGVAIVDWTSTWIPTLRCSRTDTTSWRRHGCGAAAFARAVRHVPRTQDGLI
jgi:hypothetical protein